MKKETVAGLIILLSVLIVVLFPGLIWTFLIYGVTLLLVWLTANLLSKLILGKSLKKIFFE